MEHARGIIHEQLITLAVARLMPHLNSYGEQTGIWGYRLKLHHPGGRQELFTFSNIGNVIAHRFGDR